MAAGTEFERIRALLPPGAWRKDGTGPGDDAFVFDGGNRKWVSTVDASVQGVHFRLDWTSPAGALRKCLLSNLSDLEAMGAEPAWALLTLGWPPEWDDGILMSLAEEIARWREEFGIFLAGGDTVASPGGAFFSITASGSLVGKPLLRSAARPGQTLFVSGSLGASAAGLHALQTFGPGAPAGWRAFIQRHGEPVPDLGLGRALGGWEGPVAAIDISDGLSSEANHLAAQSGCRAVIEWGKLPYDSGLDALASPEQIRAWVLHGGEEYRLLFAAAPAPGEMERLRSRWDVRPVGRMEAGEGVYLEEPSGVIAPLEAGGWRH